MATNAFINYPVPKKANDLSYNWKKVKHPIVRGLPLVVTAAAASKLGLVSGYLWQNTGFGRVKYLPSLAEELPTFRPLVILTAGPESESGSPGIVSFGPDVVEPRHTAYPDARYSSAADYHAAYHAGTVTPEDVVEALLPLVQRGRGSPYENAFLVTHVATLRAAAAASTARYAAGAPLGVLDGVPVTVKCDIPVEGYVCTFGLDVPRRAGPANSDTDDETDVVDPAFAHRYPKLSKPASMTWWPVKKLLEAGALLVAQNNMHEIGKDTNGCNPRTGTPVNWFNTEYYPGGSSSGAGSALGAGLVPIAVGTDAGGSVRVPAAFNGVFGLKTTQSRLVAMASSMVVVGPLAATTADLKAAYRTMAQPEAADPVRGLFGVAPPVASPQGAGGGRTVLAIPRAWVDRADPVVRAQFDAVVAYLRDERGYEVADNLELPLLFEGQGAHGSTCLAESIGNIQSLAEPDSPDNWPALVNAQNELLLSVAQHASAVDLSAYAQLRTVLMRHMAYVFREQFAAKESDQGGTASPLPPPRRVIVLTPTTPCVGWIRHPGDEAHGLLDGNMTMQSMLYVWLANTTGCPALTCPMGYGEPVPTAKDRGRVPMGIMGVGEWGAEESLLSWATDVEDFLHAAYPGGRQRPGAWVDVLARAKEAKAKREGGSN